MEKLLSIINKHVGYAEQEIYDAIAEYEEEKINFAKYHCSQALKEASEIVTRASGVNDFEELILNSYPLTNIK
jgi:cellobiose-specific phosphotransferase system component IIA